MTVKQTHLVYGRYAKLYQSANGREASRVFAECAEMVPRDLLRMFVHEILYAFYSMFGCLFNYPGEGCV